MPTIPISGGCVLNPCSPLELIGGEAALRKMVLRYTSALACAGVVGLMMQALVSLLLSCSYRGDIVNGLEFTPTARQNDPYRMVSAYHQSAQVRDVALVTKGLGYPYGTWRRYPSRYDF